jgi:hypothetical protein
MDTIDSQGFFMELDVSPKARVGGGIKVDLAFIENGEIGKDHGSAILYAMHILVRGYFFQELKGFFMDFLEAKNVWGCFFFKISEIAFLGMVFQYFLEAVGIKGSYGKRLIVRGV